ncbi:MAG TPA: hypothetical protein VMF30_15840 [Pirellulales bacterium]|nr:hypothetical protein [Pirellulales bacterium]
MIKKICGLMWMAAFAACIGCAMGQAPYDYCASTIRPDGRPTGGFMTRQGSVLGGMPGVPVYQSQPTPAGAPAGPTPAGPTPAGPTPAAPPGDAAGATEAEPTLAP